MTTWGLQWISCEPCGKRFRTAASYLIHFHKVHRKR